MGGRIVVALSVSSTAIHKDQTECIILSHVAPWIQSLHTCIYNLSDDKPTLDKTMKLSPSDPGKHEATLAYSYVRFLSVTALQRAASTDSLLPRVRIRQSIKQSLGKSKLSLPCRSPTAFCQKRHSGRVRIANQSLHATGTSTIVVS